MIGIYESKTIREVQIDDVTGGFFDCDIAEFLS